MSGGALDGTGEPRFSAGHLPEVGHPPEAGYGPDDVHGPGAVPETGHPAVDAALQELVRVADAPPGDQIPAFQAAHRTLRETLASIDEG